MRSSGERARDQVHLRVAGLHERRAVVDEAQPRELDLAVLELDAPLAVQHDRVDLHAGRLGAGRQVAEVALDQLDRVRGIEVAHDREAGVVRHVVAVEEVHDVVHRRGLEVLVLADHADLVGMPRRVHQLVHEQVGVAVGAVLAALPALVAHDVALGRELFVRHRLVQRLEPVGFQPEQGLQHGGRSPVEVVGAVGAGGRVVRAAARLHHDVEVRHALGAHEHQVLEQVREAAAALRLVLAAHAVPDVDLHARQAVVGREDHGHAVAQRVGLVRDLDAALLGDGGGEQDQGEQERHGTTPGWSGKQATLPCVPGIVPASRVWLVLRGGRGGAPRNNSGAMPR
jgi:hypothetical protein